jgi:hypothetical protein
MSFKLNQVVEAISSVARLQDPQKLGIQLKRLMEIDRNFDDTQWAAIAGELEYAFFSADKPGKGVETRFSEYEAFALLIGWILLEQGQPQSDAVMIMRIARKRLEAKFADWASAKEPRSFLVIDRRKPADGKPQRRLVEIVEEPVSFLRNQRPGFSATVIELAKTATEFHQALNATAPSKRGRGST